jgi:hypothetical protein
MDKVKSGKKESACLVILHSSPVYRNIDLIGPLHSSPEIGTVGGG